eukprot:4990794-Prymnesium_polylepis.1
MNTSATTPVAAGSTASGVSADGTRPRAARNCHTPSLVKGERCGTSRLSLCANLPFTYRARRV